MSENGIDPVAFGRMTASLDHCVKSLDAMTKAVTELTDRVGAIEERFRLGKAGVAGIFLGAGFALYGAKEAVIALLQAVTSSIS